MSETLICPVCRSTVSPATSMCFECHLPIKDVRANQRLARRRPRRWRTLLLVLVVLVPAIWFTIAARDDRPGGLGDREVARGGRSRGVAHSALHVVNRDGYFNGSIRLDNYTDTFIDVWATVHIYDHDQDIGEISGSLTLKPHTHAVARLDGYDDYRPFTDTVVSLLPTSESPN